jgi:hypothetical protein
MGKSLGYIRKYTRETGIPGDVTWDTGIQPSLGTALGYWDTAMLWESPGVLGYSHAWGESRGTWIQPCLGRVLGYWDTAILGTVLGYWDTAMLGDSPGHWNTGTAGNKPEMQMLLGIALG